MKTCILLHFYQPYNQQDDILLRVVKECYLPVTQGLLANQRSKVLININGALTEILEKKGYGEVLQNIRTLCERGQAQLLGSSMYHAFLPLLPEAEIERQISQNDEINAKVFGEFYKPKGFFPPEMALNRKVLDILYKRGYEWVASPEMGIEGGVADTEKLYKDRNTGLNLLFRNKRVSSLLLSSVCRDIDDFIKETQDIYATEKYWFCVMDAETFGHHRIGHEKMLFDLMTNANFEPVLPVELFKSMTKVENIELRPCTWSNEEQDFWLDQEKSTYSDAKSFVLWKDPTNPIHLLQWELTDLVLDTMNKFEQKNTDNYKNARALLDIALSSDQYWWASAKPWWSLEMIEQGAYQLKEVLSTLNVESQTMNKADEIYRKVLDKAFEWQRSGTIRKRFLDNSGTYLKAPFKSRTPVDWFNLMVLEFELEMNKSAERKDFEKAVKWRDALRKIELGSDIYDVLHVMDELWSAKHLPNLKAFLTYDWAEFSEFIKPHLIDRDRNPLTKEAFEKWKKEAAVQS